MNGDRSLAGALEDTADHTALGLGPVLVGAGQTAPLVGLQSGGLGLAALR